jgi:LCP family protein required for cell wall assembly
MAKRFATPDAPVARRSWSQRVLLGTGTVLSAVAIVLAGVAGWMAYQWQTVDRTDVDLDEVSTGGPANYLVVGSDTRGDGDPVDPGATNTRAPLADTIMVVRVDPAARQAKLLSLPRDLWVTLSNGSEGRINAAYSEGPQALVDTLRSELDIPINHYLEVDFTGFQDLVSAVDGVPMWFDRPLRDTNSGLDVVEPGCVTLDGRDALAFARSRNLQYLDEGGFTYDGTGDLGRISRQQLFLRRVIDRATDQGLSNPATLKRLVEVGTDNVTLDDTLAIGRLLGLGRQFADYDGEALETYTLPNTPRTTSGGAEIVDLEEVAAEPILELFRPPPEPAGDLPEEALVAPSEVDLTVLNSSGEPGLALQVADGLMTQGFEVDHIGNGDELGHASETATVVRHGPGGETHANTVAAGFDGSRVEADSDLAAGVLVLYLGEDFDELAASEVTGPADAAADTTSVDESATNGATDPLSTETGSLAEADPAEPDPPAETEVVGLVPGDPPPGRTCG